ncbi:HupE/UreJ family protein [Streptomyces sp. NPDC093089]|uniref:HupE/UreJ family protein n=1 Tax=Streptomyces sp. NPDC093089 TaxID=3366024 RepID=UPI003829C5FE
MTLALAVLGWVDVPTEIAEPLIALSIVYVAVENITRGESRHRVLVVWRRRPRLVRRAPAAVGRRRVAAPGVPVPQGP